MKTAPTLGQSCAAILRSYGIPLKAPLGSYAELGRIVDRLGAN